jgi:hypothetical protein
MKEWDSGKQIITDAVTLDDKGDYRSLDAMASDLINTKIPQQFRTDPRLVVLAGADLVAAEQFRLYQGLTSLRKKLPRRCWVIPSPGVRLWSRRSCRVNAWW